MSTQIAVRLPDALVAWIDQQVADGAASRAQVVSRALHRYRRQLDGERDARIYAEHGEDPELAAWVRHATAPPID